MKTPSRCIWTRVYESRLTQVTNLCVCVCVCKIHWISCFPHSSSLPACTWCLAEGKLDAILQMETQRNWNGTRSKFVTLPWCLVCTLRCTFIPKTAELSGRYGFTETDHRTGTRLPEGATSFFLFSLATIFDHSEGHLRTSWLERQRLPLPGWNWMPGAFWNAALSERRRNCCTEIKQTWIIDRLKAIRTEYSFYPRYTA